MELGWKRWECYDMALTRDTKPYGVERAAIIESRKRKREATVQAEDVKTEKRDRRVAVMLRESEYKALRLLAAEDDKTLSSYLAKVLTEHLEKLQTSKDDKMEE